MYHACILPHWACTVDFGVCLKEHKHISVDFLKVFFFLAWKVCNSNFLSIFHCAVQYLYLIIGQPQLLIFHYAVSLWYFISSREILMFQSSFWYDKIILEQWPYLCCKKKILNKIDTLQCRPLWIWLKFAELRFFFSNHSVSEVDHCFKIFVLFNSC